MARLETLVQLSDELVALLDAEAARRGTSRSALIREAVEAYLHDGRDAAISRAIVEGYRRIPPGTPDEWGDLQAQNEANHRRVLERLEQEEREAGFEPW